MNCEEVISRLPQYLDNKISEQEVLEIDKHLDRCNKCMDALDALLESEAYKIPPKEAAMILRLLRANFSLDPQLEKEGIAKVIESFRRIIK